MIITKNIFILFSLFFLGFFGVFSVSFAQTSPVILTPAADGTVVQAGAAIPLTWRIDNLPSGANLRYRLYLLPLSGSASIGPSRTFQASTNSFSLVMPSTLSAGEYRVQLKAIVRTSDTAPSHTYSTERRVCVGECAPAPSQPVSVSFITPAGSNVSVHANNSLPFTWRIENLPPGATLLRYRLSLLPASGDASIGPSRTVGAGQTSFNFPFASSLTTNQYRVKLRAIVQTDPSRPTHTYSVEKTVSVTGGIAPAPGAGSGSDSSVPGPRVWLQSVAGSTGSRYEIRAADMPDLFGWQIDVAFNDSYFSFEPSGGSTNNSLFGTGAFPIPVTIRNAVADDTRLAPGSTKVFTIGVTDTGENGVEVGQSGVLLGTLSFGTTLAGGEVRLIRPIFLNSDVVEFIPRISSQ